MTNKFLIILAFVAVSSNAFSQNSGVKKLDTNKITNKLFKTISEIWVDNDQDVLWCTYRRNKRQGPEGYGGWDVDVPFYTVFSDGTVEESDEVSISIFNITKGDFIIGLINMENCYRTGGQSWLYTLKYNGEKIDSLCLNQSYGGGRYWYSDQVSCIYKDLTISITKLVSKDDGNKGFDAQGNIKTPWLAARVDYVYSISETGRFCVKESIEYSTKEYVLDDLLFNKERSIYHGNEGVDCIMRRR